MDIEDDGTIKIYASDADGLQAAIDRITEITAEAEIGATYDGTVVRIVDFGAFINFLPGKDGLVHISQIAHERVNNVGDYLEEGQKVKVKCLDVDNRGRIKLSIKETLPAPAPVEQSAEAKPADAAE